MLSRSGKLQTYRDLCAGRDATGPVHPKTAPPIRNPHANKAAKRGTDSHETHARMSCDAVVHEDAYCPEIVNVSAVSSARNEKQKASDGSDVKW